MFNIDVSKYYPSQQKYDMARFMRYDQDAEMYDILDSAFLNILPYTPQAGVRTVTIEEGKPSLLCESIYGIVPPPNNTQYWWILMEINNYVEPSDIKNGDQVLYPQIAGLDSIFGQLNPRNN